MKQLDDFYFQQDEPIRECLLTLKEVILQQNVCVTTAFKYGMSFFILNVKCSVICGCIKNINNRILAYLKKKN